MVLPTFVIFGIVLSITQPVTIIANLLRIIAFMKVPSLQTHTSNLLIFALSIVDMISGIHQLVYNGLPLAFGYYPIFGEIGCMITLFLEYTYICGNVLLVAISIDRVLLVSMDYSKYVKLMTKFRVKVTIGICFLVCQMAAVFELSLWRYSTRENKNAATINFKAACLFPVRRIEWFGVYLSVCFYFLPLILVGFFSVIFVKRLVKKLGKDKRVAPGSQNTDNSSGNQPSGSSAEDAANATNKRYIKSAVTLAALVSAMGISMLPYCIYRIVEALSGNLRALVANGMYMVSLLNPFLDPLFFAATQKGIREYYGNKARGLVRKFCNTN